MKPLKLQTETGSNSYGPYIIVIYRVGKAHGKNVLIKYHRAFFQNWQGKMQENYSTQLVGACCWIGTFRSMIKATAFYVHL